MEIPKTPRAAAALDHLNDDQLWVSATQKELDQVIHEFSSFRTLAEDEPIPAGYKLFPITSSMPAKSMEEEKPVL